jgi:hypothetical protein
LLEGGVLVGEVSGGFGKGGLERGGFKGGGRGEAGLEKDGFYGGGSAPRPPALPWQKAGPRAGRAGPTGVPVMVVICGWGPAQLRANPNCAGGGG